MKTYGCSLSVFYIKPQQGFVENKNNICCSLSVFYIKPQLQGSRIWSFFVVPYQYSTSNRNRLPQSETGANVVPYQYSTSNRNSTWG